MKPTGLKMPANAAGKMAELVAKPRREEKSTDVLMYVGAGKDKASGQLKVRLRGVGTNTIFQYIRNAMLGRRPASTDDVKNLFIQRGMTPAQADNALRNLRAISKNYSAAFVNDELKKLDSQRLQQQATARNQLSGN